MDNKAGNFQTIISRGGSKLLEAWNPLRNKLKFQSPVESDEVQEYSPACDIYESEKYFGLRFDLPGMSLEEISIKLGPPNVLTVSGERSSTANSDEILYRIEREKGRFKRTFTLPRYTSEDQIERFYHDGVLLIRVPKEDSSSKKIQAS